MSALKLKASLTSLALIGVPVMLCRLSLVLVREFFLWNDYWLFVEFRSFLWWVWRLHLQFWGFHNAFFFWVVSLPRTYFYYLDSHPFLRLSSQAHFFPGVYALFINGVKNFVSPFSWFPSLCFTLCPAFVFSNYSVCKRGVLFLRQTFG